MEKGNKAANDSKDFLQTPEEGDAASTSSTQNDAKRSATENARIDLSRSDLIRLLSYLEGELQARDIVIATLRAEKAKQLLYQAKYGRLGLNDPLAALQRDSETAGSTDDFDEAAVGHMYESQLAQLERLIAVQRRAHHRAKQVLASAERRHAKTVRELEQERQRSVADAAQGDDVCALLEKERERLKQEIEYQRNEHERLGKEIGKGQKVLQDEKERHKAMVLYLINERRQLLLRLQEERQKAQLAAAGAQREAQQVTSPTAQSPPNLEQVVNELRREVVAVKRHRDDCRKALDAERQETASLREIVRTQEEDLHLIRQNILAKTRQLAGQKGTSPTSPTKLLKGRVPFGTYPSPSSHQRPGAAPLPPSSQQSRFGHLPQLQTTPVGAPRPAFARPAADQTDTAAPPAGTEQKNARGPPPTFSESLVSPRIMRRGPNDQQLPPPSRPVTFGSKNNIAPPPPPQYASPTGYASLPGDARQGSGVGRPSTASQPPPSPSNKSRAPPQQQNSDDRGRPQQRQVSSAESTPAHRWFPNEYPDGAAYGAEVEPEIAHLEAVINSFGRNAASMPPSASPNPSPSPVVWTPRNGADHHQQHSIDGGTSSLKQKRSSSVPRNGGPPAMQQSDEQLSGSTNGRPRTNVVRRSGTPNPPSRRPIVAPIVGSVGSTGSTGIPAVAKQSLPPPPLPATASTTGTIRRNPFLKAIGLRKEKKATQV
uniref:Cortactin-binding protein-2 N-terminal domain-containing protein n=1 Tax=Plectus sambesii TaxID=2011161 RepID=A0A914WVV1_9BILA